MAEREYKCVSCGGTELYAGEIPSGGPEFRTRPGGLFMLNQAVFARPFACLDCGGVSYFLTDADLDTLRKSASGE